MVGLVVWFFRIMSFPLGLACILVALDLLYVWGLDGHRSHNGRPRFTVLRPGGKATPPARRGSGLATPPIARPHTSGYRPTYGAQVRGVRPSSDTWIWWEWPIRRPALYLLFLGVVQVAIGILLWLPNYGNILWVSEHIEAAAILISGLILLRGTLKISSPLLWKKITIIKRPLSGRARPSLPWMTIGMVLCIAGLYGMVCGFSIPSTCSSGNPASLIFPVLELVAAGVAAMGLEDIIQAWQERESPTPLTVLLFATGIIGFVLVRMIET